MTIAAPVITVALGATPPTVTVKTDPTATRAIVLTATDRGVVATAAAIYPVSLTDSSGKTWSKVSDDGLTAVYQ